MRLSPRSTATSAAMACVLAAATAALVSAQPVGASVGRASSASVATRTSGPAAARVPGPYKITAKGAEIINAVTGRRLWSKAINTERPIASITKVMTAMVVIDDGHLNRKIKVTQAAENYAAEYDATTAGLVPGNVLTARQLLEGLLLPSGADAAYLLAHAYGPGWRRFVGKMNATARKLGMTSTHFANFDGLPWPTEYSTYSTPRDLMIMAAAAMKLPLLRYMVGQSHHYISATKAHQAYSWANTNLLLGHYPGAVGIKTGFTLGAGYCLLFEAKRGTHELLGVVLDSTNTNPAIRFVAAARLLNWGFKTIG
jgi:serine-type D-Ala-D-Ala carboxypeptidase (penicillin-binding protein 5/6)